MTIAGHTLGCKLNFAETSYLIGQFVDAGWQRVDFDDVADELIKLALAKGGRDNVTVAVISD